MKGLTVAPSAPWCATGAWSIRTIFAGLPPGFRAARFRLLTFPRNPCIFLPPPEVLPHFMPAHLLPGLPGITRICTMFPISPTRSCRGRTIAPMMLDQYWALYLNQYFWLQNFADEQVGLVLDALANSPFAQNTIIVFLSDHGEYGGSHGLRRKGNAVYDESIRVPFYVQFPGQSGSFALPQVPLAGRLRAPAHATC